MLTVSQFTEPWTYDPCTCLHGLHFSKCFKIEKMFFYMPRAQVSCSASSSPGCLAPVGKKDLQQCNRSPCPAYLSLILSLNNSRPKTGLNEMQGHTHYFSQP